MAALLLQMSNHAMYHLQGKVLSNCWTMKQHNAIYEPKGRQVGTAGRSCGYSLISWHIVCGDIQLPDVMLCTVYAISTRQPIHSWRSCSQQ